MTSAYRYRPEDVGIGWYSQPAFATDSLAKTYHLRSREWRVAGLGVIEGDFRQGAIYAGEPPMLYRVIIVPYWLVASLFAAMPLTWLIRRRKKRIRAGYCAQCGYDLRATQGRCPECGMTPAGAEQMRHSARNAPS